MTTRKVSSLTDFRGKISWKNFDCYPIERNLMKYLLIVLAAAETLKILMQFCKSDFLTEVWFH